jgi:hypothetical protein
MIITHYALFRFVFLSCFLSVGFNQRKQAIILRGTCVIPNLSCGQKGQLQEEVRKIVSRMIRQGDAIALLFHVHCWIYRSINEKHIAVPVLD